MEVFIEHKPRHLETTPAPGRVTEIHMIKNCHYLYTLWPTISDEQGASLAARQGFHAAVFCLVVTTIVAVLSGLGFEIMDFDLWSLINAGFMGLLALGIHRMSRTTAVIALLYYVTGRIEVWCQYGFQAPIVLIIIGLMFLSSVRGTFAYHRFQAAERLDGLHPQLARNPGKPSPAGAAHESPRS
jgi:hypothetical protein